MKYGTQESLSQLANKCRWLVLACLWSQVLVLPMMLELSPDAWKWLAFVSICSIVICGGANIVDKTDEKTHMIAAIVGFVALTTWVFLVNPKCIVPLVICIAAGNKNLKWRAEIGLVSSVYMVIITMML